MATATSIINSELTVFAPGIHTGGGIALLKEVLASDYFRQRRTTLLLDARSLSHLEIPDIASLYVIDPSLLGRFRAELKLKQLARDTRTVVCLHSLPPLFRLPSHTVCFLQNILHLGQFPLRGYSARTRLRLSAERIFGKLLKTRVDTYIVQTRSMKLLLQRWHRANPRVIVCPFAPSLNTDETGTNQAEAGIDFLYVADGEAHKNHRNLIEAWVLLAAQGIRPKLVLTLTSRDSLLSHHIDSINTKHKLNIQNRGTLSREELRSLYLSSKALIFPSFAESLGLPLIEATQLDLPIIAAELDYVRDVCLPTETFDPASPRSIARAVCRFLSIDDERQKLYSADTFLGAALGQDGVEIDETTL